MPLSSDTGSFIQKFEIMVYLVLSFAVERGLIRLLHKEDAVSLLED